MIIIPRFFCEIYCPLKWEIKGYKELIVSYSCTFSCNMLTVMVCLPGCDFISFEIKSYLRYKSIFCHKIALDVELIHFLFERKITFCSRDV